MCPSSANISTPLYPIIIRGGLDDLFHLRCLSRNCWLVTLPRSLGQYKNRGNTNVLDGVCPKPGFLFQVFFFNFKSVRLKDNHSHTLPGDFKLSVNTNLYNFVYITPKKLFGGFLGIELC